MSGGILIHNLTAALPAREIKLVGHPYKKEPVMW